jgi:hypothetical protein
MRIDELRMGGKDLLKSPTKTRTLGFEFEVALKDGYDSDMEVDIHDLSQEFEERWYQNPTLTLEQYWQDRYYFSEKKIKGLINDTYSMEPLYGWVPKRVVAEFDGSIRKIEASNRVRSMPEGTVTEVVDKLTGAGKIIHPGMTEEALRDAVKKFDEEELRTHLKNYMLRLPEGDLEGLSDNVVYGDQDQTIENMKNIVDDSEDIEEFFNLFENGDDHLESFKEDFYYDAERQEIDDQFERYMDNRKSDEMTTVDYISDKVEEDMLVDVIRSEEYHGIKKNKRNWYVEPDSTIKPKGAEIVSPPMPYVDAMRTLKNVLALIRDNEFMYTNESTGLHINIGDFPDPEQIDLLKFLMFIGERHVMEIFGRTLNTWATSNVNDLYQILSDNADQKSYNEKIKALNSYIIMADDKYKFINFKKMFSHGFFELRGLGGHDYEGKHEDIVKSINRVLRALEAAEDPNAYRDEYLKKLYKMTEGKPIKGTDTTPSGIYHQMQKLTDRVRKQLGQYGGIYLKSNDVESVNLFVGFLIRFGYSVEGDIMTALTNDDKIMIRNFYNRLAKKHGPVSAQRIQAIKELENKNYRKFLLSFIRKS